VLGQLPKIQQTAAALAQLDVLACFAETARLHNYCGPQVADEGILQIRDGRHPCWNKISPTNALCRMTRVWRAAHFLLPLRRRAGERPGARWRVFQKSLTRPPATLSRRAGEGENEFLYFPKSGSSPGRTWRVKALTSGRWRSSHCSRTPVHSCRRRRRGLILVDRIFTRIGASDDLTRGQSTFMVEMTETANILNNATPRSPHRARRIGRGTSTFDGLSLAWSIVEHLHNQVGAKTLFATHYHELTELAQRCPRLKNFNVAVREWRDQIVFLRKIVEGGTDKSYGIHVARLAWRCPRRFWNAPR